MGLDGLDLCGGGAGASSLPLPLPFGAMLPLGMGTAKFFWAEGFDEPLVGGGGGDAAPFTGCGSTSIELEFMAELDMADSRLRSRSSGGRFNGWVSGSYLLLRREEPASVECRERREDLDVDDALVVSLWWWEAGRADFLVGDEDEAAATLGLWGISLSSRLEVEALFLEALLPLKNFIRAAALESWGEEKGCPDTRLCRIFGTAEKCTEA